MHTGLSLALTGVARNALNTPATLSLNFANQNFQNPAGYVRTNNIYNSTMVGGVNGTLGSGGSLPTTWTYSTTITGLSYQLTYGSIGGRAYIDFRASGTATTGYFNLAFDSGVTTVLASGQTWTVAADVSVSSGSLANINTVQMQINENTSVGTFVTTGFQVFTPTSTSTRYWYTRTLSGGVTVERGMPIITFNTFAGAVDITFRIFAPQFEQTGYPSTFIPTTTAAVSVTTYASSNPADVGNLTYTRSGPAYAPDSAGNLIAFADGVIRITSQGYWGEETRTNSIPNSTMVGATASTLPTGWSFQAAAGLTLSVVGIGTEFGRNYVDWSVVGTTVTTTFPSVFFQPTGTGAAAAASGQTWTNSFYYRVVSGTLPASGVQSAVNVFTAAGAYISTPIASSGSNATGFTRVPGTGALPATTAFAQGVINFGSLAAGTYSLVLRIYQPQLELGANASTDIPTTSAAVTRAADVGYYNIPSLSTAYTLAAVGSSASVSGTYPVIAELNDGVSANFMQLYLATQNPTSGGIRVDVAAVTQLNTQSANNVPDKTTIGTAGSIQASRMALSFNGGVISAGSGSIPTVSRLYLGRAINSQPLNGPLAKTAVWSSALSNPETIYRSAGNF